MTIDFSDGPDHEADTGILKKNYCQMLLSKGNSKNFVEKLCRSFGDFFSLKGGLSNSKQTVQFRRGSGSRSKSGNFFTEFLSSRNTAK